MVAPARSRQGAGVKVRRVGGGGGDQLSVRVLGDGGGPANRPEAKPEASRCDSQRAMMSKVLLAWTQERACGPPNRGVAKSNEHSVVPMRFNLWILARWRLGEGLNLS